MIILQFEYKNSNALVRNFVTHRREDEQNLKG